MTADQPKVLITEAAVHQRVAELARTISADYAHAEEVVLVGVLRGAFIFLADLSRRLAIPRRVDFIALTSYGAKSGTRPDAVRLVMDLSIDISGRHVLVVEDIVDTGHTLRYLLDLLAARNPTSLKSCALVRKPARQDARVAVDYLGFEIPDVWVVGYGLDYADRWRTLPYIGVVEPDDRHRTSGKGERSRPRRTPAGE